MKGCNHDNSGVLHAEGRDRQDDDRDGACGRGSPAGKKSALLDLDPQTNAVNWFDRRKGDGPDVASIQPGAIRRSLDAYRGLGMDWVFIDTPGKMESASVEAAKHADIVLVPSQAQIFSIETLEPLKRLLDMAGSPPTFVVLNLVHPNAGAGRLTMPPRLPRAST